MSTSGAAEPAAGKKRRLIADEDVLTASEWAEAQAANRRIREQERELDALLTDRQRYRSRIEQLGEELATLRRDLDARRRRRAYVHLQLLAVRKEGALVPFPERLVPLPTDDDREQEPAPPPPPAAVAPPPAAPEPEPLAVAPPIDPGLVELDLTIDELRDGLAKVDEELASIGERELELRRRGFGDAGKPFRSEDFTLYARRLAGPSGRGEVELFLSPATPLHAVAVPLPGAVRVSRDPATGLPRLVRAKS